MATLEDLQEAAHQAWKRMRRAEAQKRDEGGIYSQELTVEKKMVRELEERLASYGSNAEVGGLLNELAFHAGRGEGAQAKIEQLDSALTDAKDAYAAALRALIDAHKANS